MNLPVRRSAQVLSVRPLPSRELAQRQPAPRELVRQGHDDVEYLEGTRHLLPSELRKLIKRREVKALGPIHHRPGGYAGVWVKRLRPPTPVWRKVAAISAGVLAVLGVIAVAIGMLISALAAIPVAVWVVLGVLLLAGGTGGTTVIVKVWVK